MTDRVPPVRGPTPGLHLDELLREMQRTLQEIVATRDRSHGLLDAIVAVGSELDLPNVLRRIVETAVTLVEATYGALGVINSSGMISQFITVGIDPELQREIGPLPSGHGILGVLINEPRPLVLRDLRKHPASIGFPPSHPAMKTFLGVPIRVRGEVFGNLYLTDKRGGGDFDEEDEKVVVALASAVGVAVENARLYEESRQRERWLTASAEVTTTLLSGTDPSDALVVVARRAKEVTGADVAIIALLGAGEDLVVEICEGLDADRLRGLFLPIGLSDVSAAFLRSEPLIVSELSADSPVGAALGPDRLGVMMLVPLGEASAIKGVLGVVMPPGVPMIANRAAALLRTFAGHAAVALELAAARLRAEEVVLFEDRDRIARDLHDLVIQRLFASGMQLESSLRLVENEEAAARIHRVVDDLDGTIREIRSAIYALQPSVIDKGGSLRTQLLDLTGHAAAALGFSPSLQFEGPVEAAVPAAVSEHLLAVLSEALSNVSRHAQASAVSVSVGVDRAILTLKVEDDGVGLAMGGRRSGLTNLEDRALGLNGACTVTRASEAGGTQLIWTVPLPQL